MGTPFTEVYDAFLAKVLDDDWDDWDEGAIEQDLSAILLAALPNFKFPRVSLKVAEDKISFEGELQNGEIQVLATYMKCEWYNRTILSWENVKSLYTERDFSQANLLDKLRGLLEAERREARRLENFYYRAPEGKSYDYKSWAN